MTDIMFTCQSCNQSLEASPDMAGQLIDCPKCQTTIEIPFPRPALDAPMHPPQKRPSPIFSVNQPSPVKKRRLPVKKVLCYVGIAIGVVVVSFFALVVFSAWYFNPKVEVSRTVNTVLKSWHDGNSECVAYYDDFFDQQLISPTDWEIRSCEIVADKYAHLVVFVRSSNKGGLPIQKNWKFSLQYKGDRWRLWGLQEL